MSIAPLGIIGLIVLAISVTALLVVLAVTICDAVADRYRNRTSPRQSRKARHISRRKAQRQIRGLQQDALNTELKMFHEAMKRNGW